MNPIRRFAGLKEIAWASAAFLALLGFSDASQVEQGVEDVQIGERDNQTRIALMCFEPCSVTKRENDVFLLHGANADFNLNLSERSRNIFELVAISAGDESNAAPTPWPLTSMWSIAK